MLSISAMVLALSIRRVGVTRLDPSDNEKDSRASCVNKSSSSFVKPPSCHRNKLIGARHSAVRTVVVAARYKLLHLCAMIEADGKHGVGRDAVVVVIILFF